jgi:predicted amidophosphoribosyltransferase
MYTRKIESDEVVVLGLYEVNLRRARTDWARRIIQLKHGDDQAVEYFADWVKEVMPAGAVIVPVPSARAGREDYGVAKLAAKVAREVGGIDGSDCLCRFESMPKVTGGGARCERIHFDSIEVRHAERFIGRQVVLLDDVITTGATVGACKFLLLNEGAASVKTAVLARAVRREFG